MNIFSQYETSALTLLSCLGQNVEGREESCRQSRVCQGKSPSVHCRRGDEVTWPELSLHLVENFV